MFGWFGRKKGKGMTPYQRSLVGLLVRAVMILGGGELLDEGQWEQAIGGLIILGALGWSAYQKLTPVPATPAPLPPDDADLLNDMRELPDRKPFKPYGKTVR
jgi:hypothetical protein